MIKILTSTTGVFMAIVIATACKMFGFIGEKLKNTNLIKMQSLLDDYLSGLGSAALIFGFILLVIYVVSAYHMMGTTKPIKKRFETFEITFEDKVNSMISASSSIAEVISGKIGENTEKIAYLKGRISSNEKTLCKSLSKVEKTLTSHTKKINKL